MKFPFFHFQKKSDLTSPVPYLKEIACNSLLLERRECTEEPALGTSKIGGIPHLPVGFEWPCYEAESYDGTWANRPLAFIAQFDLRDAAPFDKDHRLPASGFLYFFYDVVTQKWGFDPKDNGCARVYYFDVPAEQLHKAAPPADLAEEAQVPLSVLSYKAMDNLPAYEEFCELTDTQRFGKNFDWDSYDKMAAQTVELPDRDPADICKLLGYADLIQGSMLAECARVTVGLSCGSPEDYKNISKEQQAAIAADAMNWTLLAQFGTLSDSIMFGDAGCIYFYIRKEDLAACRFDRIWLCLQCG